MASSQYRNNMCMNYRRCVKIVFRKFQVDLDGMVSLLVLEAIIVAFAKQASQKL